MKRAMFTLVALIAVCHAQSINISGVVKKNDGAGLEGVKVRLGIAAIMTTTGGDGSFTLKNGTGIKQQPHHTVANDCSFLVENNRLLFGTTEQAEVKVMVYDCNGRLIVSHGAIVSEANHSITLPHLGSGIHIYRISINNEGYTFRSVARTEANRGPASSRREIGHLRQASATARINDALLFMKAGYQLYRIAVTKPDTSDLQITMTPLDTGTITDADGIVYKTVRIGNLYWMAENLRTTKYNDGTNIGSACQFYNNTTDAAAKKKWGALYTLDAINAGKLAPTGWHIPSKAEYDTLVNYLIAHGYNYDGTTSGNKIAKSMAATTDWQASSEPGAIGDDLGLNNASGFSALPAGWNYWGANGFTAQGSQGYWYTSTTSNYPSGYIYTLWWINADLSNWDAAYVSCSVRLVKHI